MFRSNTPVSRNNFFGRKAELAALRNVIRSLESGNPRWLVILGRRKIGKTSLLIELRFRARDSAVRFVVLDTFDAYPVDVEIFRTVALKTLDAIFSHEVGVALDSGSPFLFRSSLQRSDAFARLSPDLRGRILEIPEAPADQKNIRFWLELPEELGKELDLNLLVAWDEFQELSALGKIRGGFDPFPLLRSVWQRHEKVSYIISGSERTMLTQLVTDKRSPFFQHFSIMELGPLAQSEATSLLIESAPPGRQIPLELAASVVEILGGHPFYLQMFGEQLTFLQPPYDKNDLKRALGELVFSRSGRLAMYFEAYFRSLVGRSSHMAAILDFISRGPARLSEIAKGTGVQAGAAKRDIERLKDAVVRMEDGRYTLEDRVFGLWLKWRAPGGTVVPMQLVGDEEEKSVASELAKMGFELVYQSRASRGSFDLLAVRADQQLGVQVKRKKLPLRFKKTEWNRMKDGAERLGWSWVVVAVSPEDGQVLFLDPAEAKIAKEVRVNANANIENLLTWLK